MKTNKKQKTNKNAAQVRVSFQNNKVKANIKKTPQKRKRKQPKTQRKQNTTQVRVSFLCTATKTRIGLDVQKIQKHMRLTAEQSNVW